MLRTRVDERRSGLAHLEVNFGNAQYLTHFDGVISPGTRKGIASFRHDLCMTYARVAEPCNALRSTARNRIERDSHRGPGAWSRTGRHEPNYVPGMHADLHPDIMA